MSCKYLLLTQQELFDIQLKREFKFYEQLCEYIFK